MNDGGRRNPVRDARYFARAVGRSGRRQAALTDTVVFGSTVTFRRTMARPEISYRGRGRSGPEDRIDFLRIPGGEALMGKALG